MKHTIKGLMLAAGSSSRMGTPKQLLPWGNATLIEHCISVAQQSKLDSILVVLGAEAKAILPSIEALNVDIIINREWASGMASTIRTGVDQLSSVNPPDGILIMLADQPFIKTEELDAMIDAFDSKDQIIASAYKERLGVPALFGAAHFDLLRSLSGDKGAGAVLNEKKDTIKTLPLPSDLTDIDTMERYISLRPNTDP
ncbi:MAG: nucleotidyltransferase family protein [Bacteroidia bacterium]|nr:nucleotidyltransferase family protein [Bacteroidia bacterium]